MNPYKVLGVAETATQEEIRAAYLSLVKQYHPDKYSDGPLKAMADEKLKEINQAYDLLTKRSMNGSSTHASGPSESTYGTGSRGRTTYASGSGYGRRTAGYTGRNAEAFRTARMYISRSDLNAARTVLDGIYDHNAEWNYLYGIIYRREGWEEKAWNCIRAAYMEEPSNPEYRYAYNSMRQDGEPRQETSSGGMRQDRLCASCSAMLLCSICTNGGWCFFC